MKSRPASIDEAIRIEAYILSEKAGHPSGMEHAFWQQAQTILHGRLAAGIVKPAKARKPAAPKAAAASRRKPAPAKPEAAPAARKSSPKAGTIDLPAPTAGGKAASKPAPKRQPAKRPPSPRKAKS